MRTIILPLFLLTAACGSIVQTTKQPPVVGTYVNTQWQPQPGGTGDTTTPPVTDIVLAMDPNGWYTANGVDAVQYGYSLQWTDPTGVQFAVTAGATTLAGTAHAPNSSDVSVIYSLH